jgi:hypothetical protein
VAGARTKWIRSVVGYTAAGVATSALLGAGFGLLGAALLPPDPGTGRILIVLAVAALALARESILRFVPLPQLARQTEGLWVKRWGGTAAPILWGLDLGLTFSTWLTFSGAWVLAVLAVLLGSPAFGAGLFVAYWLGRALSVWIAPLLMETATDTPGLLASMDSERRFLRWAHVAGLVVVVLVLGSLGLNGSMDHG